jgi:uncharacterized caspase-like protein
MSASPRGSEPAKSYAVIVGISQYRDPRIRKLDYTRADAQAFYNLLLDRQRAGLVPENVKLLLDGEATRFSIEDTISDWLFKRATAESTVLVFFAGHGGTESDKTGIEKDGIAKYLLPWDTNPDNLFASAVSSNHFNQLLKTIKAERLVMFMDSCYSGGLPERGARDIGIVDDPYKRLAEGKGRLVIAAAQPNQRSWEEPSLGHGIFTYHLIEALQGKADLDQDGYVSILEVYNYLQRVVPDSVRRLCNSLQEPLLVGDIAGEIVLTANGQLVRELETKREQAERRRREKNQEKRQKLSALRENDEIPLDVYLEALSLIEKPPAEMTAKESKLAKNLDALLKDGLGPEVYLVNRDAILGLGPPPPPQPRETETGYCIHCGAKMHGQNLFCTACGRRVQP